VRRFASFAELAAAVGADLGPGPWLLVDQKRVDEFAATTGDRQWIHVDPERAASGPFGTTVAHGYLTLSLVPLLVGGLYDIDSVELGVNYGLNRVRFPAPVLVPSSIRASLRIGSADEVPGGYQLVTTVTVESDGVRPGGAALAGWPDGARHGATGPKPVCVAEVVARFYPASS
jgi:acyl dehydratase